MECRVLTLSYDAGGKPIVPGGHHCVKEDMNWWSVYSPAVERRHPLLCHLWEEATGTFAVFTEASNWATIDPKNAGVSLEDYENAHSDWQTYRCDCSIEGRMLEDTTVKLVSKPATKPTALAPIVVGELTITRLWPSVGSNIGGERIAEASTKPGIRVIQ